MLNSRGQAYSAFKLLIAAVVAMAILGILFSVIQGITIPGQQSDPSKVAKDSVETALSNPAIPQIDDVTFNSNSGPLNSLSIAKELSIDTQQVCVLLGEFEGSSGQGLSGFSYAEGGEGRSIVFNGNIKNAKIGAICNTGAGGVIEAIDQGGRLKTALKFSGLDSAAYNVADFTASSVPSGQLQNCEVAEKCVNSNESCCLVVLLRAG